VLAFVIDLVLIIVFVLIGRSSHDENPVAGALVTLWPFAVGLVAGWLGARAWRTPTRIVPTGLVVWASTVIVGMLLRIASGQGVQLSFVIVASVVLAVFLLGWRLIARIVRRRK
jgi:FlaA1/EpsC-like NDP-sugar epimerase